MTYQELQAEIFFRADQAHQRDKKKQIVKDRDEYLNQAVTAIYNDWKKECNYQKGFNDGVRRSNGILRNRNKEREYK